MNTIDGHLTMKPLFGVCQVIWYQELYIDKGVKHIHLLADFSFKLSNKLYFLD